jgi:hypothetical protein
MVLEQPIDSSIYSLLAASCIWVGCDVFEAALAHCGGPLGIDVTKARN